MDYDTVCEQLRELYVKLLERAPRELPQELTERMGAPWLVKPRREWCGATRRVLIVGQAPHKWGINSGPDKPEIWHLEDATNDPDRAARTLMEHYSREWEKGGGGAYQEAYEFIKAKLVAEGTGGVVATNLFRCALQKERDVSDFENPWNVSPKEAAEIDRWQRGVLRSEVEILKPTHVMFFTGPDQDHYLEAELGTIFPPKAQEAQAAGLPTKAFTRVRGHPLPSLSVRTYHPRYWIPGGYEDRILSELGRMLEQSA